MARAIVAVGRAMVGMRGSIAGVCEADDGPVFAAAVGIVDCEGEQAGPR